jgi:hypothetical protein
MKKEELEVIKEEVKAITIDGPSGIHFKRVLNNLLDLLIKEAVS